MASQLDLTKVLTLNGEELLDKKLRIEKAKEKPKEKPKVKAKKKKAKANALTEDQKGNNTSLSPQLFPSSNIVQLLPNFVTMCF